MSSAAILLGALRITTFFLADTLVLKYRISQTVGEMDWALMLLYMHTGKIIPYFLGCKTDFFSFQNNPKDLDPSYKTDLDL